YSPPTVLTTIAAEGGRAQPVGGTKWNFISDLTWLPGNRNLVVAGRQMGSGRFQLYDVSLQSGETRPLTHDLSVYVRVRASADGNSLLALQNQILTTVQ